jgi:hypothetical protein
MSEKTQVNTCPDSNAFLRYGKCSFDPMYFNTTNNCSSLRGAHSANISGFIRSIHCGNISKPLIGAEHTKDFSCSRGQNYRAQRSEDSSPVHGDSALTHCSLRVWFKQTNKQTPWSESASELYGPSDRRL